MTRSPIREIIYSSQPDAPNLLRSPPVCVGLRRFVVREDPSSFLQLANDVFPHSPPLYLRMVRDLMFLPLSEMKPFMALDYGLPRLRPPAM